MLSLDLPLPLPRPSFLYLSSHRLLRLSFRFWAQFTKHRTSIYSAYLTAWVCRQQVSHFLFPPFTRSIDPDSRINTPSPGVAKGRQSGPMSPHFFFRVISALARPISRTEPTHRHSSFYFADSYVSSPSFHLRRSYPVSLSPQPPFFVFGPFGNVALVFIFLIPLGVLPSDRPSTPQIAPPL